ncbi:MAG: class I SAM-dependent methyltransferase [Acidobacteriota bacterium]
MAATVRLARGREASLVRRHPWVFSGSIDRVEGDPGVGESVAVRSADGGFLAYGAYSPASQIRVRAWGFDEAEIPGEELIHRRLETAVAKRRTLLAGPLDAVRLVHGESDGLPGLIIDRFGATVVLQVLSAGAERWRRAIADRLAELDGVHTVFERSDADVRAKEGLDPRVGLLRGEEPPESIEINEHGRRFFVDCRGGHKTGFYLDQRPNRDALTALVKGVAAGGSGGTDVLDAFCYSGGFSVAAARGGAARLTQIDASDAALTLAARHLGAADWGGEVEQIHGNAFGELRRLRAEGRLFDIIVLDPPKFAETKARVERASRGYKDINLLAFQLLRPGGHLMTFSCSGRVSADLFGKIVASAAADARRDAQVIGRLGPGSDHPVALAFPEGEYLKGLVCRAD